MSINIQLDRTMQCIATATTQLLNPELLKVWQRYMSNTYKIGISNAK